jgi:hypothetical protein
VAKALVEANKSGKSSPDEVFNIMVIRVGRRAFFSSKSITT